MRTLITHRIIVSRPFGNVLYASLCSTPGGYREPQKYWFCGYLLSVGGAGSGIQWVIPNESTSSSSMSQNRHITPSCDAI